MLSVEVIAGLVSLLAVGSGWVLHIVSSSIRKMEVELTAVKIQIARIEEKLDARQ